jgi:hypothetical protein
MSDLFKIFADDGYRFGSCFVRPYDRRQPELFGDDFLLQLYRQSKSTLKSTFCGMSDLSAPTVCAYLSTRNPLLLMCVDEPSDPKGFEVIGYSFPSVWSGPRMNVINPDPGRTMFMGYSCSPSWYRSPEFVVATMLTGIYYFHTFNLLSIQGQSYPSNHLTRKFLAQFGTREVGTIPDFLFDGKQMLPSVQSYLGREEFERYVASVLSECRSV